MLLINYVIPFKQKKNYQKVKLFFIGVIVAVTRSWSKLVLLLLQSGNIPN